ncbi:unnamed protein product [Kuraishia capsulata CBS 1993]|uniref:C3HC-type domain-containing protein n=1 Tax=Kuraishia capsulata CBS 1993 TaxID=1382522 RepID=W6MMF3_9ASCO|nr:uncharacterized protein KUCA_T00003705001 [Kuraishia capsulata CBS 1993]CDK27726.1 unnamed protein product [Kuraishia capsulata CBS 1993]
MEKSTTNAISNILSTITISPSGLSLHHHLLHKKKSFSPRTKSIESIGKRRLSDESLRLNAVRSKRNHLRNPGCGSSSSSQQTFNPYDTSQLLERMSTFEILRWTIDDQRLTPLECSRFGWHCARKNELECSTCHAVMMVKLDVLSSTSALFFEDEDPEDDVDQEEESRQLQFRLVDNYLQRLHSDHFVHCPWKNKGVPLSYYLFDYTDTSTQLANLENTLLELQDNVDLLSTRSFKLALDDSVINDLQAWTNGKIGKLAATVGLLGWELKIQTFGTKKLSLLKCPRCLRRILLSEVSNAKLQSIPPNGVLMPIDFPPELGSENDESDENEEEINVIEEHQPWCSFVALTEHEHIQGYKLIMAMIQSNKNGLGTSIPSTPLDRDNDEIMSDADMSVNESLSRLEDLKKLF